MYVFAFFPTGFPFSFLTPLKKVLMAETLIILVIHSFDQLTKTRANCIS